jgi:hypothetical protein
MSKGHIKGDGALAKRRLQTFLDAMAMTKEKMIAA